MTEGDRIPSAHTEWTWLFALLALGFVLFDVAWLTRKPKRLKPPRRQARRGSPRFWGGSREAKRDLSERRRA